MSVSFLGEIKLSGLHRLFEVSIFMYSFVDLEFIHTVVLRIISCVVRDCGPEEIIDAVFPHQPFCLPASTTATS